MVKFNWLLNKILLQRLFLLSVSGVIACEILTGYIDYNNQPTRPLLTILSAPSILSATFDITNVRSYAPYDLFDADPNSFKKDVDFYFSLFDKSTAGRKAGHLPRNVDSAAQMQETLITPVVEYMESMSYRQARESSRMKSSRGFSSLDEAESSARDQHAASIGEQVDLQDSIMKHT